MDEGDITVKVFGALTALGVTGGGVWGTVKGIGAWLAKRDAQRDAERGAEIARLVSDNSALRGEVRMLNDALVKKGERDFERMLTTINSFADEVRKVVAQGQASADEVRAIIERLDALLEQVKQGRTNK